MTQQLPQVLPHNSFGIPRLTRRSGEMVAGLDYVPDAPLNPWLVVGHERLFAPVDRIEEQFARFRALMPTARELLNLLDQSSPPLVVVSGGKRTGKTSLINRCADHVAQTILDEVSPPPATSPPTTGPATAGPATTGPATISPATAGPPAPSPAAELWREKVWKDAVDFVVVPDIGGPESLIPGRNNEDLSNAIARIIFQAITRKHRQSRLETAALDDGDLQESFQNLSRVLLERNRCALVIVPKVPYRSEEIYQSLVMTYFRFRKPGIVMFFECSESEAELWNSDRLRRVTVGPGGDVIHLKIGKLRSTDSAEFVRVRLSDELHWRKPYIDVAREAVSDSPSELHYECVGDLQKIFFGLADELLVSGETRITLERLRAYREQIRARQDDGLRRTDRSRS
jgi:hypothetical protein